MRKVRLTCIANRRQTAKNMAIGTLATTTTLVDTPVTRKVRSCLVELLNCLHSIQLIMAHMAIMALAIAM